MIWTLVLALIVTLAAPAAAEFTENEKANVRNLILGVNLIRSGLSDQIAAGSPSGYATAWQAVVDCHDALGFLFGTQIRQGDQARSVLAATPRSGWLAMAWKSLDRCIAGLDAAQSQAWAATNKYGQARFAIAAFPRGGSTGGFGPVLSAPTAALYQNPKPASYPKVIGPHGDYDFAQEDLWFAIKYAHDALYIFGSRYLCDVANYEGIIMGALADVRFRAGDTSDGFDSTAVDDIDNVLWLQKFALEDTAVKYLAATMNEYAHPKDSDALKAALPALVKHNDSWKNLDRAIRNTVCFVGRVACDRTPH
jgi:hypothetical protein